MIGARILRFGPNSIVVAGVLDLQIKIKKLFHLGYPPFYRKVPHMFSQVM